MNNISKKQMNDVIAPHNDVIRRPSLVPEPYVPPVKREEGGRIETSPFFDKTRKMGDQKVNNVAQNKSRYSEALLWAFFIVALLALGFFISNYFSQAIVKIEPISKEIKLDSDFIAGKDVSGDETLVFKFVSLKEELSKEVPATIEKKIQKKATGKVVIYNSYSTASQRLVINTRLESPDHKIFRIEKSVVVPGATIVNGKVTVPGSVESVVYADVPGKEYNIGTVSDFTFPGLKGDPRYSKFRAVSKPDAPIAGGFSGTIKTPSDEAIAAALLDVKNDLKNIAIEKARAQIPKDTSFFSGSTVLRFEEVPQDFTKDTNAKVSVRAVVSVFFFDTKVLTQKIIESASPEDKDKSFLIPNLSALSFSFADSVDNVVFDDLSKIRFHLSGDASIVGQIDSLKIRTALAGKNEREFSSIITKENNIYKATETIRPVWKRVFPTDTSKIILKVATDSTTK